MSDLSGFQSHFNQVMQTVRSRISALEDTLSRLGRDHSGQVICLKGDPGSIEDATKAAAKFMAEELRKQHESLAEAVAQLNKQQNEFMNEIRNEIQGFKATALSVFERTVRQSVKDFLVVANIINEDGSHHESLKGDKGDTGAMGATGPKGDIGYQGPKGDQGDKGDVGELNLADAESVGRHLVERVIVPFRTYVDKRLESLADIDKRLQPLENKAIS